MNIIKQKEEVLNLLETYESLRDNDDELISFIWTIQLGKEVDDLSALDFLDYFLSGKLANTESIVRMRRKLQEKFPHLRGKKWGSRHAEQINVIEQLKTI